MFGLEFIKALKPCKWRYKPPLDDGVEHFGFIAQEVDELASKDLYGFVVVNDAETYGLNLVEFIAPIVKAIQELDKRLTIIEGGLNEKLGNDAVRDNDPVGSGHDLAKDMGDV